MTSDAIVRGLDVLLAASRAEASDFASTRPEARVEYGQQRQAEIQGRVADGGSRRAPEECGQSRAPSRAGRVDHARLAIRE
jgi:hypothetical protein